MGPGGFVVDPATLRGLSLLLDRLGEDGRAAAAHTAASTAIPWAGEGLINLLAGDHEEVREQVRGFFLDVDRRLAGPAADRVRQASADYLAADREAAAELAELGPPSTSPGAGPGPRGDAFADRADPVRRLRPPADHEATYPHQPHWSDLASPGALLRDAIWGVTEAAAGLGLIDRAYDPYEWVLKPVVGDWAAVRGCADVFAGLADAAADMSRNLDGAASATAALWSGAGGAACAAHLSDAAGGLGGAQRPLRQVAEAYHRAAEAMNHLRNTLASLLNDIADAAIMAAASAAVAGLAGSTGVGLPVALVIGAFTLTRIYTVVRGVMLLLDAVALGRSAIAAEASAIGSFGRIDADVALPVLATS